MTDLSPIRLNVADQARDSQTLLGELFEHAPSFIALAYGPDHRFAFANRAFQALAGETDLVGRPAAEALPQLAAWGLLGLADEVFASGRVHEGREVEITIAGTDPVERRYVDFSYRPLFDEGAIAGVLVVGQDVTGQKLARDEVALLRTNLIHISRLSAMGTMASTLAHTLNQPLTAITNYVGGCERLLAKPQAGAVADLSFALNQIKQNALEAGDAIRSLRALAGRDDGDKDSVDLADAAQAALALARTGGRAPDLACDIDLGGLAVRGDAIQVQQVLFNLIRNAIEAMEGRAGQTLSITAQRRDATVEIAVADNGPGFPADAHQAAFDAFMTTKKGAVGLGLPICRTIVEAHGGRIAAEPNPGGGARLVLSLPAAD
jgi:C4-dicarboxylate-specific signal transduction histidine kinase